MFKRTFTNEVTPTVEEMANEFWEMDADEQARFFNIIGNHDFSRICMQLQYIQNSGLLAPTGRKICKEIGNYLSTAGAANINFDPTPNDDLGWM